MRLDARAFAIAAGVTAALLFTICALAVAIAPGPTTSIKTDVTSIVQTWADHHDAGDNGFILRVAADNPAANPVTPFACMNTLYKAPKLDVVYF